MQTNKKIYIFVMLWFSFFIGCATPVQRTEAWIEGMKKFSYFEEVTVEASYRECFKATISVFRDWNRTIVIKDYNKKMIFARYEASFPSAYYNYYAVFFNPEEVKKTKVILKGKGMFSKTKLFLERIKKEIELQRELKE
ncbi:MAG: hypothetical protein P9M02_02225 [Candidatus Susulua stagnicola]|nr:hypothetical protein [Candidatus Susulua stagnicola]